MCQVKPKCNNLLNASLLTFALSPLAASIALAETPNDHIVVTATKTGETALQETPIAITLLSEEDIEASGIENVQDLMQYTPGLSIWENTGQAVVYIRGVGTNLEFVGSDPSTTVNLDGVYISRAQAIFTDFLGVERIEVLRGPQGTLYGRNSTGGTINVVSHTPDENAFLKTRLEVGNYEKVSAMVGVGGSLIGNTLTGSFHAIDSEHDGYVKNEGSGPDFMDEDRYAFKGALRFAPTDELEVLFRADSSREDETGVAYKATLRNKDGSSNAVAAAADLDVINDPYKVDIPDHPEFDEYYNYKKTDNSGASIEVNYDFSFMTFTSLSGYRSQESRIAADTDWTPVNSRFSRIRENQDQITQEFRFSGQSEHIDWTTGIYHFKEEAMLDFDALFYITDTVFFTPVLFGNVETEANAFFAHGTFHINDVVSLSAGTRYSEEEKTFDTANIVHATETWHNVSSKTGVEVRPTDDHMIYFTVSEGFKSGGYNFSQPTPPFDPFKPEEVFAYELGVKSGFFDNTLRTNLAIFQYEYDDMQVKSFNVVGDEPPFISVSNASEATIKGAELESKWLPNNSYDLAFNVAYLNATYDKFIAADGATAVDVSGNKLNASPRWKTNAIGQVHFPLNEGNVTTRLEWAWQSQHYLSEFNNKMEQQKAYSLWNARVSYAPNDESWSVAFYVKNIDNQEYTHATQSFSPLGITQAINEPRTQGIVIAADFM